MVASLAAVSLSACVMPPKEAAQEHALPDGELGLGSAATPAVEAQWWQSYKDPQLNALIERVLTTNPQLSEALARVRAARADVLAASAASRPSFALDGNVQREHYPEHFIYPPPYGGGDYWQGQLGLNLNWDLDFWGQQAALIKQAKARQQAAVYDAAAARLAIAGTLARTYLQFYRAEALANIAADSEKQRQAILDITSRRVKAGLDTLVELHEAEAALPQAQLARHQALATAELGKHELAALAGEGAGAYSSLQAPQPDLETALPLPSELPADLLSRRPDVLAAKARVLAATEGRVAAHQAFYPDVNLSAFAGFTAIGLGNLFRSDDITYGGGPAIHLPLFESARLKSSYHRANAELDDAVDQYNAAVLTAIQQVADQLSLVQSSAHQLDDARRALAASEAAYELAKRRYDAGLANYLIVLNAESQALEARRSVVDITAAQATARVALLLTCGGSFDPASPEMPKHDQAGAAAVAQPARTAP
jgi:NodT family efflux transporter outer membrane factor (OMF) lipoprotein